jgi:hypothetical protein
MLPFLDSTPVAADAAELRARAARAGYLFFRGLLPAATILALRRQILDLCARHGFLEPGSDPADAIASPGARYREGDPEYMALYDDLQRLEAFHALAHQPPLMAVLGRLFGEAVLVHPRNIARVMFPQNHQFTTPAHQDFVHIQGTEETYSAWIPLGDCPRELGNLEVLPGSHRFGVLPVRSAYGAGGLGVETDQLELEWAGGDFACGDVLLFQSLCVHRATNNRTPDRVRLSVDYRYQGVSQPVVESSLLPHFNRLPWDEIYQGWQDPALQYYWRDYDLQIAEFTRQYHASAGR